MPATHTNAHAMHRLLDPESIAVIGASANPAKRGYQIIRTLRESGYRHPIYPVNPRATEILGLPVFSTIAALPKQVDIAVVAVPATMVPETLRACAEAGVGGAVVLANGFAETGDAGAQLTQDMRDAIAGTDLRVIGPNTSGMLNTANGANLVGLSQVPPGPISVITQSGNMLLSLVQDNHALRGPGFHTYIGLGNQADLRYDECLTALADHPKTNVIAVHAEGFVDGRAFAAAAARTRKPVVMLRGGRSAVGQRTVRSHTGSIAASDAVATAVLRQAGVELVTRSDELAVVAGALATTIPQRPDSRVAVLSDGGGHAALTVDALASYGIELAELTTGTQRALADLLGPAATVANPVDVAGATDTDPTVFAAATTILMGDPGVGLVLVIGLFGGYHLRFDPRLETMENEVAQQLSHLSKTHDIPLLVQSCYAGTAPENHEILRSHGIPVVSSLDHAARIAAALDRRRRHQQTLADRSTLVLPSPAPPLSPHAGAMSEPRAREVLTAANIDTGPWTFATTPEEVAAAVLNYQRPCAVRVVSPDVIHKSDIGGVRLDISAGMAANTAETMRADITKALPTTRIDGWIVTPMAQSGIELLVGATQDPIFGPIVAFGSGGVLVEALTDVAFRAAPLTEVEAMEMIAETRVGALLDGPRDLAIIDRKPLAELLVRVGDLIAAHPEIDELDLNPVIANHTGLLPVDVRILITESSE